MKKPEKCGLVTDTYECPVGIMDGNSCPDTCPIVELKKGEEDLGKKQDDYYHEMKGMKIKITALKKEIADKHQLAMAHIVAQDVRIKVLRVEIETLKEGDDNEKGYMEI